MNWKLIQSLCILAAIFFFAAHASSQVPQQVPSSPAPSPTMSEDDRLTFMQSDDSPAPREPSSTGLILKSIGALLLVISLLFFGTWLLKKLGVGGKKGNGGEALSVSILSTLSMGNGRTISTIRFGDRVLLVGATQQQFTLLAEELPLHEGFSGIPRSVAQMLEEEGQSFDDEFEAAKSKLGMWQNHGGLA